MYMYTDTEIRARDAWTDRCRYYNRDRKTITQSEPFLHLNTKITFSDKRCTAVILIIVSKSFGFSMISVENPGITSTL